MRKGEKIPTDNVFTVLCGPLEFMCYPQQDWKAVTLQIRDDSTRHSRALHVPPALACSLAAGLRWAVHNASLARRRAARVR